MSEDEKDHSEALHSIARSIRIPDFSDYLKQMSAVKPLPAIDYSKYLSESQDWKGNFDFNSSKELLKSLNNYYEEWVNKIDGEDTQPVIYAILQNGAIILVESLAEAGFNGITVKGKLNEMECVLLTHQAGLQFLCVAEPITEQKPAKKIGFVYHEDS